MLVSGTGGGSQDLGPLSGCICSKESPVPSQQAARITIAPPKKSHLFPMALDVMQLRLPLLWDSVPSWLPLQLLSPLEAGRCAHSACSSKLFTSAAIIRCYKPHSKGLFALHAVKIEASFRSGESGRLFLIFLINNRLEIKTMIRGST